MASKKVTIPLKGTNVKKGVNWVKGSDGKPVAVPDKGTGPGRPPIYDPMSICELSIQIIETLGVANCTKTAVAVAFYDPKFDPDREGERERLLDIGDKRIETALSRRKRKAERKRQLVAYSQLLKAHHCPEYEELVAAVAHGLSSSRAGLWIVARLAAKKEGKKNTRLYSLTDQRLSRRKKTKK